MVDQHMFTAVVLAGDRPGDTLAAAAGVSRKALIRVGDTTMLGHVVGVLLHSPYVGRVLVVANRVDEIRPAVADVEGAGRLEFVEGAETPVTSLMVAMTAGIEPPLLVAAADMPLLPAAAFDHFCRAAAEAADADIVAALVVERDVRAAFPYMKRTFIHLREGGFKGCNLFALLTPVAARMVEEWVSVENRRKRPMHLLMHFGLWTAWRAYRGHLSLTEGLDHVSRRFGVHVQAVLMHDPRLAVDVDLPEHLYLARAVRLLGKRPWPLYRIAFLFDHESAQQVAEGAAIAKELIARHPEIEVAVLATSAGPWDTARTVLGSAADRCRIIVSNPPAWHRAVKWIFGSVPSIGRISSLLRLGRELARFDAVVVPERTGWFLKALPASRSRKPMLSEDGSSDGRTRAASPRKPAARETFDVAHIRLSARASADIVGFLEKSIHT
jgi:molybdopterin-guanine dinucleotide biosynthesis protein A